MTAKRLVLFDFDGTLTTKDTLFKFIQFYHGTIRFLLGFVYLSPMLIIFKLGFIKNQKAKELVLKHFFKDTPLDDFNNKCKVFAEQHIPRLIRPQALNEIKKHLNEGAVITVVSASPENWVRIWCEQIGIPCIATRLKTEHNKVTGAIDGFNCYGVEKVNRVKNIFTISEFNEIYVYGDSSGDKEMLEIASHPHFKPFQLFH